MVLVAPREIWYRQIRGPERLSRSEKPPEPAPGYLDASFTHKEGVRAYGARLDAGVAPRYGRMWYLAWCVYFQALNLGQEEIPAFENEVNENYACEYLYFEIRQGGLTVYDRYAGRAIAAD
jgi:hypothetical protein